MNNNILKLGSQRNEYATFDHALKLAKYGIFHVNLIAACSLSLLAAGFENGLGAYVLPAARCELNLNSAQVGLINVGFLIGGCLSAFLWGLVADTSFGRRNLLISTLFADGFVTISSSYFATTFPVLFVFRIFNGFLIGASGSVLFNYIGEFFRENKRAQVICYIGLFFTASWLLLPALAAGIMPLKINWDLGIQEAFVFKSWRLYWAVIGLFPVVSAFWLCFLPRSPKLLLAQGHSRKALKIVRYIWRKNTGLAEEDYPIKYLLPESDCQSKSSTFHSESAQKANKTSRILKDIFLQIRMLLRPPLLASTCLTTYMLFSNMFGYYGLGLWLPELFKRFDAFYEKYPNGTTTVCQMANPNFTLNTLITDTMYHAEALLISSENSVQNISSAAMKMENHYNLDNDKEKCATIITFHNTIIIGLVCLVGNFLSGVIAGKVHSRRFLPILTALLGGLATASIYWLRTAQENLIVASIFQAAMATGNMVLNSVVVDIFPTKISALAMCTAVFAGRFGALISNLVFGLLLDISCEIPIFLVAAVVLSGGVMAFLIPERRNDENRPLDEEQNNRVINSVINEAFDHNSEIENEHI